MKTSPKAGFYWVVVLALVALMFVRLPPMVAKQDTVLNTYRALVEVDALARQQFIEPITDDRLVDGAIRGMMLQLDPYSGYITAEELPEFEHRSAGDYLGLGMEIAVAEGRPVIIAPVEGSPAARAGIMAGDFILGINGREVEGLSVFDLNRLLSGDGPSPVRMRIQHTGGSTPEDVVIAPGPVSIQTVRGFRRRFDGRWDYLIDPDHGIGYIRISRFNEHTAESLAEAVTDLRERNARALVLDLRFNPGGRLEQAVASADQFLSGGLIVSTVTRRMAVQEYHAVAETSDNDWKLAVLVNRGSASAAEVLSGVLQDRGRGMVIGERTFGKGSVQHLVHLQTNGAAIKLTTAYYRLPSGRIIHRHPHSASTADWGIRPEVEIPLTPSEQEEIQRSRQALDQAPTTAPSDENSHRHREEIVRDRQLEIALRMLGEQLAAMIPPPPLSVPE